MLKLEKLDFKVLAKNGDAMYELLDTNRARLSPWFWWADEKVTPNKLRFNMFMVLYILSTKYKEFTHKLNPIKTYDEQFLVRDKSGKIGGMMGLDNIDLTNKKAEIWGFAFKGNTETVPALRLLEDYCINALQLDSVYGKVQSENRASKYFWTKYGFDSVELEKGVRVSSHNPTISDIYTYTKVLSR